MINYCRCGCETIIPIDRIYVKNHHTNGKIRPQEIRDKMSQTMLKLGRNKGNKSWCKGLTKETDNRLKIAGLKSSNKKKGNVVAWNRGIKITDPIILKRMSDIAKISQNRDEIKKKIRESTKKAMNTPEVRNKMIRYWNSDKFKKDQIKCRSRISNPQKIIYNMLCDAYECKLEYCVSRKFIDVAIPDYKIAIEYDGSYWHDINNNKILDYDKNRQLLLESLGWKFIRYRDKIPSFEQLNQNIQEIINNAC